MDYNSFNFLPVLPFTGKQQPAERLLFTSYPEGGAVRQCNDAKKLFPHTFNNPTLILALPSLVSIIID